MSPIPIPKASLEALRAGPVEFVDRHGEPAISKATTQVVRWDPVDLSEVASLGETIHEQMREALTKRILAWERATLEMAFDAGLDVRSPWGPEIAEYAAATYKAWFNGPLTVVRPRGITGVSDYVG